MQVKQMESVELITFVLGRELYGIEVKKVREILTYLPPTKLPNTKEWINGVINIRGEVTPVVDLRVRFKTSQNIEYSPSTPIIAAKTLDGRMIGLVVDEIQDFATVDLNQLIEVSELGVSLPKEYIVGLVRHGDLIIVMLDVERILALEEL